MKMYRTQKYFPTIEVVEVERVTDPSVYINGKRRAKRSSWENYFETWQEARDFLEKGAREELAMYRRRMDEARSELDNVLALKNPEDAQ